MTAFPDERRGPAEPTTQPVEGFFEIFFVCVKTLAVSSDAWQEENLAV